MGEDLSDYREVIQDPQKVVQEPPTVIQDQASITAAEGWPIASYVSIKCMFITNMQLKNLLSIFLTSIGRACRSDKMWSKTGYSLTSFANH